LIETIKQLFLTSPTLAWSIVSVLVALVAIAALWEHVKWWWLNTWMQFPLVGRIATLSRDSNPEPGNTGWFKSEKTLCRSYKEFMRIQDEHAFREMKAYILKSGDNGRTTTPGWIWLLTASMVFVEALGFSYVLAGYTLPGASENLQGTGALGIAFLLSILLVGFTHFAGRELYTSFKIKQARREWIESGRKDSFKSKPIDLASPQNLDDDKPAFTQLANRVGTNVSYALTSATIVLVVIVAIFATYVRGQALEKTLLQETVGQNTSSASVSIQMTNDGLNMTATSRPALPAADAASDKEAQRKAIRDGNDIDRHGGWGTFIVLAFIFVFLQILGVVFGYKFGFAGQNSAEAYRAVGGGRYATYQEVREHYRAIADTAQSMLEALQQRLMYRNAMTGNTGQHTSRTFSDFMEETRDEEARDHQNEQDHMDKRRANGPSTASSNSRFESRLSVESPIASTNTQQYPLPPPVPMPPPVPETLYYFLDQNNLPQGPASLTTIRGNVASGKLPPTVKIAVVGGSEWLPIPGG
jgi:hypothetical protein